jgi:putative transposase
MKDLEIKIAKLPSMQPAAFAEIISGLYQGKPLLGPQGILTQITKDLTQLALQGEMDTYLTEDNLESPHNRRNGYTSKIMKTAAGSFELETPRDRNCTFEPQIVKKRQTILTDELDSKILALYGLGTSYSDISGHLQDIYWLDVSSATISTITDRLIPKITEWRSRPLEAIYAIVFLDAMFYKAKKDNVVVTKVIYNVMGINQHGHKDILGFYDCESEGAHFWLGVLNDLKTRGVQDILVACIDGLKGFPDAIQSAFPNTEVQLCIVHQIRNSLKHVASKNQKEFMVDLKAVYQAPSKDTAEFNLLQLEEKWGKNIQLSLNPGMLIGKI